MCRWRTSTEISLVTHAKKHKIENASGTVDDNSCIDELDDNVTADSAQVSLAAHGKKHKNEIASGNTCTVDDEICIDELDANVTADSKPVKQKPKREKKIDGPYKKRNIISVEGKDDNTLTTEQEEGVKKKSARSRKGGEKKINAEKGVFRPHPLGWVYGCVYCNMTFTSQKEQKEHESSAHSDNKTMALPSCEICQTKCWAVSNKFENNDESVHLCDECGQSFQRRFLLCIHIATVHVKNELKCAKCDYVFYMKRNLLRHQRQSHGAFKCDFCTKEFLTKSRLRLHIRRIHETKSASVCETCGKTFTHAGYLQRHIQAVHDKRSFACSKCPKVYMSLYMLRFHEEIHYTENEKTNICQYCGFKSYSSNVLLSHVRRECGDKMEDRLNGKLKKHAYIACDNNSQECDTCGFMAHSRRSLKLHKMLHGGN